MKLYFTFFSFSESMQRNCFCVFSLTGFAILQSAYYHSGGWRINPNLYEEGKVCLSLLNTWTGRGNEVWDSKSSSILQVLVSLQGLVLNSKPYFNEAGYDKQIGTAEGEKNSLSYNENTFLLNCKTIMSLMRRPPKVMYHVLMFNFLVFNYLILLVCVTDIPVFPFYLCLFRFSSVNRLLKSSIFHMVINVVFSCSFLYLGLWVPVT